MIEQQVNPTHSFEVADAVKYGSIEKALIIKEIRGMQTYKLRNKGQGWVYYSAAALVAKFPYMKPQSIARWMGELVEAGHLEETIQNKAGYDRTKSYKLPEADLSISQNEKWISQNERSISQNGRSISQNEKTIPPPTTSQSTPPKQNDDGEMKTKASQATKDRIRNKLIAEGKLKGLQPKPEIVRHSPQTAPQEQDGQTLQSAPKSQHAGSGTARRARRTPSAVTESVAMAV
jgi:hypothetical protein